MRSSKTVCAENTEKRLKSYLKTLKLHRIIIIVYKIICFTHTKLSTPAIFFDPHETLWTNATHATSAKVWLTPPTNPLTNTSHATHAISQTRKTKVYRNINCLTTAEPLHRCSHGTYIRYFENLFWIVAFKLISTNKQKIFPKLAI